MFFLFCICISYRIYEGMRCYVVSIADELNWTDMCDFPVHLDFFCPLHTHTHTHTHTRVPLVLSDNRHPQNAQLAHILTPSEHDGEFQEQQPSLHVLQQGQARSGQIFGRPAQELFPCFVAPDKLAARDGASFIYQESNLEVVRLAVRGRRGTSCAVVEVSVPSVD